MARVIGVKRIHGAVHLLPDVAGQPLVRQRWKFGDALPFQAGAQFGFAPPFLAVQLMPSRQLAVEGAVAFATRGRQEVRDADIHPTTGDSSMVV